MSNSFARAFLQVLALLTGVVTAAAWRDRHNCPVDYPELRSGKAELALGVNGAQSFLRTPVALAGGALNLGAWLGHQQVALDREWSSFPMLALRVRAEGASELSLEFRGAGDPLATVLRLSNRPERPSGWFREDAAGSFVEKHLFPYVLPSGKWVHLSVRNLGKELETMAGGEKLPGQAVPAAPLRLAFRGDSTSGLLRIDDISVSGGGQSYEQSFSGEMPWLLFLLATVAASMIFFALELVSSPRAAAAFGGAGFLVLCALLALYRGTMAERYPLEVDLTGVPSRIETRSEALARLRATPPGARPVLLWLGGSQAWGAGASAPDRTAFARLRAALGEKSGLDWVSGAISGARVAQQKEALDAVAGRRKIAFVVLTAGVNDAKNPAFAADLEAFAGAVKAAGARLLLVPEPVEPEPSAELLARQAETAAFARRAGLPAAELQAAFRAHADDGFLWWDFVHLSDAGARIAAEALEKPLAAVLGEGR